MRKETLSYGIRNTTNGTIPVSLFGNNADAMDNANANTRYRWNVTGFTITNETNILLEYRNFGVSNTSIERTTFSGTSLQNVINALNGLNFGVFFIDTETVSTNSIVNTSFVYGSGFNNIVTNFAIQNDGKILCVGLFTTYQGVSANNIIRLNTDGTIDATFVYGSGFNNFTIGNKFKIQIALQNDGKIIVGGNFTTYNGVGANRIISLNTDGSIDGTFVYGSGFDNIGFSFLGLAIQSNGKIICVGDFSTYNGVGANTIIRLNTDGSIDTSFVGGSGFSVPPTPSTITIQSDGKFLVGGEFSTYQGASSNRIIRLNTDGSIDTSFVVGSGFNLSTIYSITLQSDEKVLVGGSFTSYKGVASNRIIRLNTDGSKDTSFVIGSGFNNDVNAISIQSDGKIMVGGNFTTYQGVSSSRIIRLNTDGSKDTSWLLGNGFNNEVYAITIKNNGNMLVGGQFTIFNTTTSANRIIELLPTTSTLTSTFINNYNNTYAFGNLQILNTSQTATLSYSFNLNLSADQVDVFVNAVLIQTFTDPLLANGTIPVVAGDTVSVNFQTTSSTKGTNVFIYNITTGVYIRNENFTGGVDVLYNFVVVANNSYLIGMSD